MVVSDYQALSKCQVILTIVSIHMVVIFGILFPDISCFHSMKSCRVFQEECLHLCHLKNTLVVAFHLIVPCQSSALLDRICDHIHIDNMIAYLRHDLSQDAFIDTRKYLCAYQIIQRHLLKAFSENKFFFHVSQDFNELLSILSCNPLRHEIIAPCLMRCGNKAVETCQILHTKCSGRCCKQNMRYQFLNSRAFAFKVSGGLFYKSPEWCFSSIVYKALEYLIGFHISSTTDDSFHNTARLCILRTADSSHNSKMHL